MEQTGLRGHGFEDSPDRDLEAVPGLHRPGMPPHQHVLKDKRRSLTSPASQCLALLHEFQHHVRRNVLKIKFEDLASSS
eukprot:8906199-Lingulodinium_polyedra.AAC.1